MRSRTPVRFLLQLIAGVAAVVLFFVGWLAPDIAGSIVGPVGRGLVLALGPVAIAVAMWLADRLPLTPMLFWSVPALAFTTAGVFGGEGPVFLALFVVGFALAAVVTVWSPAERWWIHASNGIVRRITKR